MNIFHYLFNTEKNKLQKYRSVVDKINALEDKISSFSDQEIQNLVINKKNKITDQDIQAMIDIYACLREVTKRKLNKRFFDVQLIGGMILNDGNICEMKTGEGKTLVATLSASFNAICGKKVHIVTVNDYLVKRDFEWMRPIYEGLGLTVGCVTSDMDPLRKNQEYAKDIIYVTNTEIGFDYLRDNMQFEKSKINIGNKNFNYAIIDEVDSILIDEARTPLIISGQAHGDSKIYIAINKIILKLQDQDYEIDEKHKNVQLTDSGNIKIEEECKKMGLLKRDDSLYDINSFYLVNHVLQSLKAHKVFKREIDYIKKNDEILIIDEFTGRIMDGRRYSEGLHQAIEAKEGVTIQKENQTLASITYQNFFRMYDKLSGMTGTAKTEEKEFFDIYGIKVIEVPTNKALTRKDLDDQIYRTEAEKIDAIILLIKEANAIGQPTLIGTVSIEKSENLSKILKKEGIKHTVLNAKHHEKEAEIIAQAGRFGSVTIATNMAGRGTDIMLGGNLEKKIFSEISERSRFKKLSDQEMKEIIDNITRDHNEEKEKVINSGGLFVIGSERHESRRIDNQLRGRSGRQGDPGKTQFFLSLEDDLLRIFGGDTINKMLGGLGMKKGEVMNSPILNRLISKSQKRVETFHYEARKNVLRYDDIIDSQRRVIYEQRINFIESTDPENIIKQMIQDKNEEIMTSYINNNENKEEIISLFHNLYHISREEIEKIEPFDLVSINQFFIDKFVAKFNAVQNLEAKKDFIIRILLFTIDECWREQLYDINHIKESIHLRSYAQKDPLTEFKIETYKIFQKMMDKIVNDSISIIFDVEVTF